jgi:hypothetical protein
LYAKYLNKHLTSKYPNILANATHPGFVDTKSRSTTFPAISDVRLMLACSVGQGHPRALPACRLRNVSRHGSVQEGPV